MSVVYGFLGFLGAAVVVSLLAFADAAHAETVTLEPVQDNTLFESPPDSVEVSSGAGTGLFVGKTSREDVRRAILRFDLAGAVPADATIDGVSLTLRVERAAGGEVDFTLHRLLRSWGEAGSVSSGGRGAAAKPGDATWFHAFFPDVAWNAPGGDFVLESSATTVVADEGVYAWSGDGLVDDVRRWLNDPGQNFGWVVRGEEVRSQSAKRISSRESPQQSARPQLVIEYSGAGSGSVRAEASTWGDVKSTFQ